MEKLAKQAPKNIEQNTAIKFCSEAVYNAFTKDEIEANEAINYYKWSLNSNPNQSVEDKEYTESCLERITNSLKSNSENLTKIPNLIDTKYLKNRHKKYLSQPEKYPMRKPIRKPICYPKANIYQPIIEIKLSENTKNALSSIYNFIELAITKRLSPQEVSLVVETQIKMLYKN